MKQITLLSIFYLSLLASCVSEPPIKEIEYIKKENEIGFLNISHPKSKPLLDRVEKIELSSTSFIGEFTMRTKSGEGLKESNNLKGEIAFDKISKRVMIKLAEPFFGMIVTKIVSTNSTIKIRSAGNDRINTLPMGDITMVDPRTQAKFTIPFQVVYYTIVLNFTQEFKSGNTLIDSKESKVLVKKDTDEFLYLFSDTGLDTLEYHSKNNNLKAISKVIEKDHTGLHPPRKVVTKVTDYNSNMDRGVIEITYDKIKRNVKISENEFNF